MPYKKISQMVWGASPAGITHGGGAEPGTKVFFENVLNKRFGYEIPWLLELIRFPDYNNKTVLEVGCGAGYDAYQFCRHGAIYTGIDIAPENVRRTRQHLAFYGYTPTVMEGDAENLPFGNKCFDTVFSNGVLHHTPDMAKSFREAYRVLKRGGEFWVIVYHKNSIFHWITLFLADHVCGLGFLKRSFKDRLSMIEYTTSPVAPLVNVYSCGELKQILQNAGFVVPSLWIRKLVKEDLPGIPLLGRLWRFIPREWLDMLGKRWGWYVIARAIKE